MRRSLRRVLAVGELHGHVEALEQALATAEDVDAVAVVGDLGVEWGSRPRTYRELFRALGEARRPAFWVPGRNDAPVADYLRESYNMEVVHPQLHGVHGTLAIGPGHVVVAGMGGEIADDPDTIRAEEMLLRYPGWEAEYRLKPVAQLDEYERVFLFATPPAHKGLGHPGSAVVAELIKTYAPRLAVVAGPEPADEELGTTLVVCPGRLADGRYALVDLHRQTVETRRLSQPSRA